MTVTPGIACGYWKARKSPRCARSSAPELGDVLAVEQDLPLGDLVGRVTHDRVGERRLAGAVRAHDACTSSGSTARSTPLTISVPSSSATCRFFSSSSCQVRNSSGLAAERVCPPFVASHRSQAGPAAAAIRRRASGTAAASSRPCAREIGRRSGRARPGRRAAARRGCRASRRASARRCAGPSSRSAAGRGRRARGDSFWPQRSFCAPQPTGSSRTGCSQQWRTASAKGSGW